MPIINSQQYVKNNHNVVDHDDINEVNRLKNTMHFSNEITCVSNNTITFIPSSGGTTVRENEEKSYYSPALNQCNINSYFKHHQHLNGVHDNADSLVNKTPVSFRSGKIVEKETGGTLYTRTAQYIEYESDLFRVKNPFYSNYVAAEEVIMGGLFSMTGLSAPRMLLCNDCDNFFVFNKETRGDFLEGKNLSSFACVASRVEPGFKDLGDFLLDEKTMVNIIKKSGTEVELSNSYIKKTVADYQQLVEAFHKADGELKHIQQEYPNKSYLSNPDILAKIKSKNLSKFTMLEKLNQFLPEKLRDEQLKHFFVSRLLNNWDYLNFAFCNFGYFLDESNYPAEFKGMTVDFGGSGTLGFGGLSKNESYERAIKGARPENPLASTSLFTAKDAKFSSEMPHSLTGISSIPRSRPLLSTIREQIQAENNIYETGDFGNFKKKMAPALEVAYRLLVLPDNAIEDYLRENWIMGKEDFPYRDKEAKHNIDTSKITKIIKDRKQFFIEYIGQDNIKSWEENNILQAVKIRGEIADSLNGLMNKIYTIKPVSMISQTI